MQLSAPAIPSSHQMVPHTRTIAPTGKSFGTSTGRFPTDYWTTVLSCFSLAGIQDVNIELVNLGI